MIVSARFVRLPSLSVSSVRFCSVRKNPGATAFTRSPGPNFAASSPHMYLVKLITAAFATPYPATRVSGRSPASDAMFIIEPAFCLTIACAKTIVGSTVPKRLRSTTCLTASVSRSKNVLSGAIVAPGMLPPAAFISTSMRPYMFIMAS